MKRIAFPILLIVAILLTACGSSAPVATEPPVIEPTATQAPSIEPTLTQPPVQPAATETLPAPAGVTEIIITLDDNTIAASQTTFQAGVTYIFVITNNGFRLHNFNINPPISVAGSLDSALSQALLVVTKENIEPGETYRVEFTFPASAAGQTLEFSCLIQRHYDDGMIVPITVTQ